MDTIYQIRYTIPMTNLDDPSSYKTIESLQSAIDSIDAFGAQLTQAWEESSKIVFSNEFKANIKNVVVCGMGGSRFTPLAVKELYKNHLKLPYVINDDYTLPGFVDGNTLVILSSYSGTTEEVLACGEEALKRGAMITAVTVGGSLTEMLGSKYPHYQFTTPHNPSGQPRIGVGYMTAGHIGIAHATGIIDIDGQEIVKAISESADILKKNTISTPIAENSAKRIAQTIFQKYPYIITSEFLQGFGNSFGNAINETGKNISSPRVIPEINHHMMEGLQFPDAHKAMGIFVFFFSKLYDTRIQKRFTITKDVVEQNGLATYWHELQGSTKPAQLFEAIGLGSYVTLYLSVLYGVDPNLIPWVDLFKKRLKE